jgi:hypothetical protein
MKKTAILYLIILLMITVVNAETKVLLIGNGAYEDEKIEDLPGAIKDVERLAEAFEALEIADSENIKIKLNLPSTTLKITIKDFLEEEKADRKILYYSGHGYAKDEKTDKDTYLIPTNTIEKYRGEFLINITEIIKEAIDKTGDTETIIILDSCYSGGILKEKTKGLINLTIRPKALIEMIKGTNMNIMVASDAKEEAIEEAGENGKGLPIGNLTSQFFANCYLDRFDHIVKDYYKEKAVFINSRENGVSFLGTRIFPDLIRRSIYSEYKFHCRPSLSI